MALLLAVLESCAIMRLQQPMLGAEPEFAESALADYRLDLFFALVLGRVFLVVARRFLGHAATKREREVDGAIWTDGGFRQCGGGVQMPSGENEA